MRRGVHVIGFIVLTSLVFSQELPKSISFDHIGIPGTVRSSELNDMVQDPDGLLWFAGNGLFQYDGATFKVYKYLPDSTSIGGQEINCLLYDKIKKRLLIATRNIGVVEYSYETNSLRRLPVQDGVPFINSMAQTDDGRIWATSFSSGLFYLENDSLKKFTHPRLNGLNFTAPYALGDQLLIGNGPRIIFLQGNEVIDSLKLIWQGEPFSFYGRITAISPDKKNRLYIGTEKQGMIVYDLIRKEFVKYFPPEISPFFNRINQIRIDNTGLVWVLFKSGGIAIYSPEKDDFITLIKNPLDPGSISGDNCLSMLQDKTGIIWVGATGDLNKYNPDKVQFQHFTHNPLDKNSLTDKMVRGIIEDDSGMILVGTDGGYINRINPSTNQVDHIKVAVPGYDGIIVPMYFMHMDKDYFLIGSSAGLIQMHKKTLNFSFYEPLASKIGRAMVRQMIRHGNMLYIIAYQRLFIHNITTKKTTEHRSYTHEKNKEPVTATIIFLDSKHRLWIGVGQGISLMHPDNSFTHYSFEKNTIRPAGSYFMVLTIEEIEGKLWVGTFDSGLWQMDISNGLANPEIKKAALPDILQNTSIYGAIPDDDRNIWMSTNHGLFKFEQEENRYTNFTLSEGIQDLEFNRLAYTKTRSGLLVFGGINGVNIFDPKQITIKSTPNKPVILNLASYKQKEDFFIDLRNKLSVQLKANQNFLRFNFFVPNYQQPARFQVDYILEPFEERWHTNVDNTAQYSSLKSGSYTFKVRVTDYDGTEFISAIKVAIDYPYWQTWWFIVLMLITTGAAIIRIIQWYSAKAIRDKENLEFLLHQRTKEIQKSREALESLNQKKDLIFSILSHDLRGPLTTLKGFLSLLIDNTDDLPKEDIKKHARSIRNSVTSSLDLIDNTLYWSLSQTGNISYTPIPFDLSDMLVKIHRLYQLTAEKKQVKFNLQIPSTIPVSGDENMIFVALRNVISNALKFTPEGKRVSIVAHMEYPNAVIQIKDEGIGMSKDYVDKILSDDLPMIKMGTSNEKGTGLGLVLCKKFIKMNHGSIQIKSIEHKGSEFIIHLPLTDQLAEVK
jgi:signal transduction histidine kinase/ligand-binding sensor domain-containing protein